MLKPKIGKVVVNISVGKSGEPLEKATKVLKELTNQTPSKRKAKSTIRDFGIRQGEPIACIVTLRKQQAVEFLKKVLPVVDNKLSRGCFDKHGNFAFGIKEHIELPGVKYDPDEPRWIPRQGQKEKKVENRFKTPLDARRSHHVCQRHFRR
jgi:large subunit ribosomal protein L5